MTNIVAFPDRGARVVIHMGDGDLRQLARERFRLVGWLCRVDGRKVFCDRVMLANGVVMALLSDGRTMPASEVQRWNT